MVGLNCGRQPGQTADACQGAAYLDQHRTSQNQNAQNAEARIEKEHTLELAFQAERSYDVYRNGHSLTRHYPGPHNALEEIQPKDYRTVYFIPQNAINAYPEGSKLTQNPTSN